MLLVPTDRSRARRHRSPGRHDWIVSGAGGGVTPVLSRTEAPAPGRAATTGPGSGVALRRLRLRRPDGAGGHSGTTSNAFGWPRSLATGAAQPQEVPRPDRDLSSLSDPGCEQPRPPEDQARTWALAPGSPRTLSRPPGTIHRSGPTASLLPCSLPERRGDRPRPLSLPALARAEPRRTRRCRSAAGRLGDDRPHRAALRGREGAP
jgi:hypothetical protein